MRRWPWLALVAVLALVGCSDTGLSGRVASTDEPASSAPSTTTPGGPTEPSGPGGPVSPAEPDGFLVFENLRTPSSLWTIDADGRNKTELPPVVGQQVSSPKLSPDGNVLAFLATPLPSSAPPGIPPPAAPPKLWVSNTDGTDARPLTVHPVADTCFDWAPDNQRLLTATTDATTGTTAARILSIDGERTPAEVSFSGPPGTCPVFLDDNTLLYPAVGEGQTGTEPRLDAIASAYLDGGAGPELVRLPGCTVAELRVSPDGQSVAFSATCDDPLATGIYTVDESGRATVTVTGSTGPFAWSPDAAWLSYTRADPADPLATSEILLSRANGSDTRRLVAPAHAAPTWGPLDGGGGGGDPRI